MKENIFIILKTLITLFSLSYPSLISYFIFKFYLFFNKYIF